MNFPLNPPQQRAVEHANGPLMILAGAGTGKTRVITARIRHLIQCGVDPQTIVAMTFTNKAAREMRERLAKLLGNKKVGVWLSTFHSFCIYILRKYSTEANLQKRFTLLGSSDQIDVMRRVLSEKNWSGLYRPESFLTDISLCKNSLLSPEQVLNGQIPETATSDPQLLGVVYNLYERFLELNRAIDFDDCMFKVHNLLSNNTTVRDELRSHYRHVLVDEFQDTNLAQFSVLEQLVARDGNICVVGDDDQSIYSWRGAMYETLERFERHFAGATIVKLEQNYRCSNIILDAANQLIQLNTQRKEKTLWSDSPCKHPIQLKVCDSSVTEARWVVSKVTALFGSGLAPSDIAVLYRTNSQSKLIELGLRQAGINCRVFGGQSFFEKREIKDFFAYLRIVTNLQDSLCLWRMINTPARGLGLKAQEAIEKAAKTRKRGPLTILRQYLDELPIAPAQKKSACLLTNDILRLNKLPLKTPEDLENLAQTIIDTFRLVAHIHHVTKDEKSRSKKIETLKNLPSMLKQLAIQHEVESEKSSLTLIDRLTLEQPDSTQKKAGEDDPHFISLMSIHAAKGLEFPAIFIVGLEDGCLPHKNSLDNEQALEEERRLLYVAITRAKERLLLSYSTGGGYGARSKMDPSRFLDDLPKSIRDALPEQSQSERKESTLKKLSMLRASL